MEHKFLTVTIAETGETFKLEVTDNELVYRNSVKSNGIATVTVAYSGKGRGERAQAALVAERDSLAAKLAEAQAKIAALEPKPETVPQTENVTEG